MSTRIKRILGELPDFFESLVRALVLGSAVALTWYFLVILPNLPSFSVEASLMVTGAGYAAFIIGWFFPYWRIALALGMLGLWQIAVAWLGIDTDVPQAVTIAILIAAPAAVPCGVFVLFNMVTEAVERASLRSVRSPRTQVR